MSSTVPTGFKETLSKYTSPFDKEAVIDDDKELWLIRIPDNLSEEDLVNMKMKVPTQKASKKALAKYEKENDKYALYKVPTQEEEMEDNEAVDLGISGHEMVAFDCLLPSREDNGKLSFAPKKFDQYLILNQVVDISDSLTFAQSVLDTPVYKRDQPEGLKMRFMPYGYYSDQVTKDDIEMASIKQEPIKQELTPELTKEESKRKRTSEEDNETEKKKAKKEKKKEKKEKKDKKVKKDKA